MDSIITSRTGKILGLIALIVLFTSIVMISTAPKKNILPDDKTEIVKDFPENEHNSSYRYFVRSIIISIVIIVLLLALAKILKKNVQPNFDKHLDMKILGKRYIDQKHYFMLVKVLDKHLLIGVSDSSMNLITELDSEISAFSEVDELSDQKVSFQSILNKLKN